MIYVNQGAKKKRVEYLKWGNLEWLFEWSYLLDMSVDGARTGT